MGNTIQEDYEEVVGIINHFFIDEPPLTLGEHRTLYRLVENSHRNNKAVRGRECRVACHFGEALHGYFTQYGIRLPEVERFIEQCPDAFRRYFNRIRQECIHP